MSSPILNSDSNILLNDIILKTDFHYKYSKGNGSLKKLNLILLKNQIFEFLEKQNLYKRILNFHDETRIEYLYDEKVNKSPVYDTHNQKIEVMINPRDAEKNLIGFRIYEDKDTIHDFYLIKKTNNYQTIINWKNILSSILIQHDFHFYYEALKKIGKGHFASIYLVRSRRCGKLYAVKAFSKEAVMQDKKGYSTIYNEIKIMRSLSHELIIKLYEVYETENSIYLLIELLEGGLLFKRLVRRKDFSEKHVALVMRKLLIGVAYIHSKGIMHRDLKPANILVKSPDDDLDIKICDFGLATFVNVDKYIYPRCGTPGFVAPEIINLKDEKHKYDTKCDIYSLGIIMFTMFTGENPFQGKGKEEILLNNKKAQIDFELLEKFNVENEAKHLIMKMLHPDSKERFSAEECLKHNYFKKCDSNQGSLAEFEESKIDENITEAKNINIAKLDNYLHIKEHADFSPKNHHDSKKISSNELELVCNSPIYKGYNKSDFEIENDQLAKIDNLNFINKNKHDKDFHINLTPFPFEDSPIKKIDNKNLTPMDDSPIKKFDNKNYKKDNKNCFNKQSFQILSND